MRGGKNMKSIRFDVENKAFFMVIMLVVGYLFTYSIAANSIEKGRWSLNTL